MGENISSSEDELVEEAILETRTLFKNALQEGRTDDTEPLVKILFPKYEILMRKNKIARALTIEEMISLEKVFKRQEKSHDDAELAVWITRLKAPTEKPLRNNVISMVGRVARKKRENS